MKNLFKRLMIAPVFILMAGILGMGTFTSCSNGGSANAIKEPTPQVPIAGTQEQQDIFRATYATEIGKDSVWATAFEKAFAGAFGEDVAGHCEDGFFA